MEQTANRRPNREREIKAKVRGNSRDYYTEHFSKLVLELEDICGLNKTVRGTKVADLKICDVVAIMKEDKKMLTVKDINQISSQCAKLVCPLLYLSARTTYYDSAVLKFNKYKNLGSLYDTIRGYVGEYSLKQDIKTKNRFLMEFLIYQEQMYSNVLNSLSYRFIRLLLILVLIGDYADVSIVAQMIAMQISIGTGQEKVNNLKRYEQGRTGGGYFEKVERGSQFRKNSKRTEERRTYGDERGTRVSEEPYREEPRVAFEGEERTTVKQNTNRTQNSKGRTAEERRRQEALESLRNRGVKSEPKKVKSF